MPYPFDHGTTVVLHRVELCSIAYQAIALDRCATGLYDSARTLVGESSRARVPGESESSRARASLAPAVVSDAALADQDSNLERVG